MALDLNLSLDNMEFDTSETFNDRSLVSNCNEVYPWYPTDNDFPLIYSSEHDVPEGSLERGILNLVCTDHGVSTYTRLNYI